MTSRPLTPATCAASPSATSSLASAAGVTLSDSPAGPMTDLFGQVVAPASPSARRAPTLGVPIPAIFGRRGIASSASAALQSSLVSRLKARLPMGGSTLFQMTWKEKATPSGRLVCLLRASGHRTSDSDCGSWPTPQVHDRTEAGEAARARGGFDSSLSNSVLLASWPTPNAMDTLAPMDYERRLNHPSRPGRTVSGNLREVMTLASWPTPKDSDSDKGIRTAEGAAKEFARKGTGADLPTLASWATPTSRDHKDGDVISCENVPINSLLGRQIHLSGSPAETAKPGLPPATSAHSLGQLNPAFSRWLQGYPKGWCAAAIRAHRSMRTRRRKPG